MAIHQRQRVAQALGQRVANPDALLSAAQMAEMTREQRTEYLLRLGDEGFWAQATAVAQETERRAWAVILDWMAE
jgi:hypothetical protein